MHRVAMSARNDTICLECRQCRAKCSAGGVCNLRTVVDCSGSSSSKSNSMYSRRHKNAKLYFSFTLSHHELRCQKVKQRVEKAGRFFSTLSLSLSAILYIIHSLRCCCCVCVFWSNVKCDARGNAQILSFIN